jgi:hypothetical protein
MIYIKEQMVYSTTIAKDLYFEILIKFAFLIAFGFVFGLSKTFIIAKLE